MIQSHDARARHGIQAFGISDRGQVREHNEDAFLVCERDPELSRLGLWKLVAVADGMGGHEAGEVASELALDTIEAELRDLAARVTELGATWQHTLGERLEAAVAAADEAIRAHAEQHEERRGMGCTLVLGVLARGWLGLANVGDSRAYRVRSGTVEQLTVDHTWAQDQLDRGALSENDIRDSPLRDSITRAVGIANQSRPDLTWWRLDEEDVVLFASDGLTRYVDPSAIRETVAGGADLESSAQALITLANEAGGRDNITVVLVRFDGVFGDPLPEPLGAPEETVRLVRGDLG